MTLDTVRWNLLQRGAQRVKSVRATELLRSAGIEPILIKGQAAAEFYPEDKVRIATDVDLAVTDTEYETAMQLCRSNAAAGLVIDLHRQLRHLDTVGWRDLFENSRLLNFEEGNIRVLRPEDNLRVLCVHWLTDGGVHKERLWDIFYGVANRPCDFDWARLLDVVSERRRRWIVCSLGLAERYLGLDLTNTPVRTDARKLPQWLTRTVESEWSRDTKSLPLEVALGDPKSLFEQVRRRFRPNPIRATVEMEGSFDARTRFFYRLGNFVQRIPASYRRVSGTLRAR